MSKAKVAPEPAPTSEPVSDAKMPKAALLRRLMEIENTIQNITASKTLDGYKSLPLHTAARRGDMREVASLLPTHHTSLSLRDESGWMPIHHAATAGSSTLDAGATGGRAGSSEEEYSKKLNNRSP